MVVQGVYKPGIPGKPGKLREFYQAPGKPGKLRESKNHTWNFMMLCNELVNLRDKILNYFR